MPRYRTRPNTGMDPSPLLPLGVLLVVVMTVFVPLTFQMMPLVMDTAQQMLTFLWVIPVGLVAALLLSSSGLFEGPAYISPPRYRRPVYRYPQTQYGGEGGPSWGLLGLMLLMLLLLPWRY